MKPITPRIQFIDLMKGICIITVVIRHLHPGLFSGQIGVTIYAVQVPVFFFLSGSLESSKYDTTKNIAVKNINRILIPYIFWFAIGIIIFLPSEYLAFYKSQPVTGDSLFNNAKNFFLTPGKHLITNYPCWFLLALFEMKMFILVIDKFSIRCKVKPVLQYVFIAVLVASVYRLCLKGVVLPFSVSSAVITLPFFYVGRLLKSTLLRSTEIQKRYKIQLISFSVISCFLLYFFMETFDSNNCIIPSNILITYLLLFSGIVVMYTLSLLVDHIIMINYMGANSIVLLVTHVIVANLLPVTLSLYATLAITFCICILLVPLCNKLLPYFVGKKDLISFKSQIRQHS